jgi:glycosyltransferase involved in cell wall biosynthesis
MTPITCLVGTFNEAARIGNFLKHATKWADQVVVVDKSSTDETPEIVSGYPSIKVWLHTVEFTPQGHEDKRQQFDLCTHDWVFLMTPGEVPTRELIQRVRDAIETHGNDVDIITVPKKLYSFGIHNPASPWSIGQQPFVVNRKRAIISNRVHRNFSLRPGGKAINIPYSETCHVYHPTHATVKSFLRSHFDYIIAEADGCESPAELVREALKQIAAHDFGNHNPELFGQECAWKLYWLGCCLAAWEKQHGNVPAQYQAETQRRINQDWDF